MSILKENFFKLEHASQRFVFIQLQRRSLRLLKDNLEHYSKLEVGSFLSVEPFEFQRNYGSEVVIPATPEIFEAIRVELVAEISMIESFLAEIDKLSKEEINKGTKTDEDYFKI